jgi:predicted O-methyltransferase YrrM
MGDPMSKELWSEVDAYYADLLVRPDEALEAALAASDAAGLPTIAVAHNIGKLLHLMARSMGARRILEIGTLGGYSTIWLARALPADGRLLTLDFDPKHTEVARGNIERAGLAHLVEQREGPALDTMAELVEAGEAPFDFIFIDADKESYTEYLEWSLKLSRPGTMIVADNVVRAGQISDAASADPLVRGVRRFNEALAAEPRVSATAIQTVGVKGHDGLAIALVVGD